jgi:predicted amidohydrolase
MPKDFTYTPLICYEAIFPMEARKASLTGADLLVNISNDAWYGRTAALYQHALLCAAQAAVGSPPDGTGRQYGHQLFGGCLGPDHGVQHLVERRSVGGGSAVRFRGNALSTLG